VATGNQYVSSRINLDGSKNRERILSRSNVERGNYGKVWEDECLSNPTHTNLMSFHLYSHSDHVIEMEVGNLLYMMSMIFNKKMRMWPQLQIMPPLLIKMIKKSTDDFSNKFIQDLSMLNWDCDGNAFWFYSSLVYRLLPLFS
jgi:hypothetical protein